MENVLLEIQKIYQTLRPSERRAADFILDHADQARRMSLEELAGEGPGNHEPVRMPAHTGRSAGGYSGENRGRRLADDGKQSEKHLHTGF